LILTAHFPFQTVVKVWFRDLGKVPSPSRKLAFLYLANDVVQERNSPNSYQDITRISLPVSTYQVLGGIFLIASKIGELLRSYKEYPAKSVVKQEKKV
jgi:hypothetical protein